MPTPRDLAEKERLDRIERHIKHLADVSAALQEELRIARQLAIERSRAVQTHRATPLKQTRKKKRR